MSLPVHLHSGMTGAPSLTATNGSINALLNACLVNGFNTQSVTTATASGGVVTFNLPSAPGFSALDTVTIAGATNTAVNGQYRVQSASGNQVLVANAAIPDGAVAGTITLKFSPLGWTRAYSGTNLGAYRQGGSSATKRYVRVYDGTITTTSTFLMRGYEAMTAISTGTGPFPTTAQVTGNGVVLGAPASGAVNPPWAIIGTPRAFYFLLAANQTYAAGDPLGVSDTFQAFFGDPDRVQKVGDLYACCISASATFPGGGAPIYVCRSHTAAAGALAASLRSPAGSQDSYISATFAFPDVITAGMTLADAAAIMQDGVALRGFMPGALTPWQDISTNDAVLRPAVPFDNITGVTGRVAMVCNTNHPQSGTVLLLDEDWGDA